MKEILLKTAFVAEQNGFIREEVQKIKDLSGVAVLLRNNLSAISLAQELDLGGILFYLRESGKERRLFYVGMTRAKHALTLCVPNFYLRQYAAASSFVRAVQQLLGDKDLTVNQTPTDDFAVGLVVIHKKFGEGVITSEQEESLTVRFNNGTERNLLRKLCVEKYLLRAK